MTVSLALALCLAAAPTYQLDGNVLQVADPIVFETGKATLKPESDAALAFVQGYLEAKSAISLLRVEVHTDSTGDARANQALSEARAAAVVTALVKRGVDCKRLIAVGFGPSKPVAANDTPEGRAANRRTVFVNAQLRGRAIGGLPADGGGQVASTSCP